MDLNGEFLKKAVYNKTPFIDTVDAFINHNIVLHKFRTSYTSKHFGLSITGRTTVCWLLLGLVVYLSNKFNVH